MSRSQDERPHQPFEEDPAARILSEWAPVIEDMAAACGHEAATAEAARQRLGSFLQQIEETADWRALAAVLRRILSGERDEAALVEGLDATDHLIVDEVLRRLGVEPASATESGNAPQAQQLTLEQFLTLVARACQPEERDLNAQMYISARRMAEGEGTPAWQHALGDILMSILDGQRDPDLSALPDAVAEKVRAMLKGMST